MPNTNRLLTIAELARETGLTPFQVRWRLKNFPIPTVRRPNLTQGALMLTARLEDFVPFVELPRPTPSRPSRPTAPHGPHVIRKVRRPS